MFLGSQFDLWKEYLDDQIPQDKLNFLNQFYNQVGATSIIGWVAMPRLASGVGMWVGTGSAFTCIKRNVATIHNFAHYQVSGYMIFHIFVG